MNNNIYSIKKGEKYDIYIKLKNRDEDKPIDLTNSIIKFQLKDELRDNFFVIEKQITPTSDMFSTGRIINPEKGEFTVRFTDEDYDKLVCERIYYIVLTWEIQEQDFAKIISSNCNENLLFKVCYP